MPDGTLVPGTATCPDLDTDYPTQFGALKTNAVYSVTIPKMPLTVRPVCRGVTVCPMLTTCVLTEQRFQDEMKIWRKHTFVGRGQFISELDGPSRDMVLASTNFEPKVLISADRAEALIDATKSEFTHAIHRSVALATRVVPEKATDFGDKTVISMVSAGSDQVSEAVASQELGRVYGRVTGYLEPWRTDIIRIERFNMDGTPKDEGMFAFKLYAPAMMTDEMIIYMYPRISGLP